MEGLIGTVVLIPFFDEFRGTGSGAEYHVAGFGALYVTGYNFAGLYKWDSEYSGLPVCTGEDRCIEGYFIEDWVAEDDGGGLGGTDFGVVIVKFVG